MTDPVSALGYLLAGLLIRNYWLAITAGVIWRLVLFMALSPPGAGRFLVPALAGAVLFVSIVYLIRRAFRKTTAPKTALDEVQEAARKIIPTRFRQIGAASGGGPTVAISDEQIMAIYQEVGTRFQDIQTRTESVLARSEA